MQEQKRITEFFSSPVAKKSLLSPRMPIFDLTPKQSTKKKPRLSVDDHDSKQTTLNAGQQKIGGQYCKECDMMYSIESLAEVEMHKKHHNRLIDIAGVKVSSSQLSLWLRKERHYDSPHGSIFRIHPDSRSTLKRKVEQVIEEIVNPSVGFASDLSIWGWDERRTVWASIVSEGSTYYIAGVIVTEPLFSAQCSVTRETICDGEPIIGVNRLWTHFAARRKGIASEILDVIRKWYFTGVLVPRNRVAFSDPTDLGRQFAEHYLRKEGQSSSSILIYQVSK
ncbi:hypothetical protein V3C99_002824 [Haemonchus contortus]